MVYSHANLVAQYRRLSAMGQLNSLKVSLLASIVVQHGSGPNTVVLVLIRKLIYLVLLNAKKSNFSVAAGIRYVFTVYFVHVQPSS